MRWRVQNVICPTHIDLDTYQNSLSAAFRLRANHFVLLIHNFKVHNILMSHLFEITSLANVYHDSVFVECVAIFEPHDQTFPDMVNVHGHTQRTSAMHAV